MTDPVRVIVTGVAGGSIGEQVCKALYLGWHGYDVLATNLTEPAMRAVKADRYALLPPASSETYLEELLRLVKGHSAQFVIPGSDPELVFLSSRRSVFSDLGVGLLCNSPSVVAICVDKVSTFEALAALGVEIPATLAVRELADLDRVPGTAPWIVKPARGSGGSALAFIAQDRDELRFFARYLLDCRCPPLVQAYLVSAEQEYTVGVLHDPDGVLMGSVVLHRWILSGMSNRVRVPNRTDRRELGEVLAISSGISQGSIVDFPAVREQAERIAQGLRSAGPLNIQGRWNGAAFVPFEINPRFSGTTPMRAMAGFNEPGLLIDWHLHPGRGPRPRPVARCGHFTRGLIEHFEPEGEPEGGKG